MMPDAQDSRAMNRATLLTCSAWATWAISIIPSHANPEPEIPSPVQARYGTISGQLQSITMHRDYRDLGASRGSNSSLGLKFNYRSPAWGPLEIGLTHDWVAEPWRDGHSALNCNEDFHLLSEAWLRARLTDGLHLTGGRQVINGEVFRADPFRQKSRALEALVIHSEGLPNLSLSAGHAIRLSNWIQDRDRAQFNDFGDVFGAGEDTDGVSWIEGVYDGWDDWEVALFNAHAHGVTNLTGGRFRWQYATDQALLGYARHEHDTGRGGGDAEAFGLSFEQRLQALTLECGSFSVRGNNLAFQEVSTGLNHALGSLMLICDNPYAGGADSAYLKAVYPRDSTVFYGLYAYTHHQDLPYNGHELNLVIKQKLDDALSVAVKFGIGLRDQDLGDDILLTDSRLFITQLF